MQFLLGLKKNQLATIDFVRVLDETLQMGFKSEVCLSHYNEPLMDERICDLAIIAKSKGFSRVFLCTNADFLTDDIAQNLDGVLDDIGVTLYAMKGQKFEDRKKWILSLFQKTKVKVTSDDDRMITHNSPIVNTESLIKQFINNPCHHPLVRMIVNHKGEMLLCCDDLINNFGLGTIHENTIESLWYGERHQQIVLDLLKPNNRILYLHCTTCPRR